MTLWWYSYSPCEKFMRTEEGPTRQLTPSKKDLAPLTDVDTCAHELSELFGAVNLGT